MFQQHLSYRIYVSSFIIQFSNSNSRISSYKCHCVAAVVQEVRDKNHFHINKIV